MGTGLWLRFRDIFELFPRFKHPPPPEMSCRRTCQSFLQEIAMVPIAVQMLRYQVTAIRDRFLRAIICGLRFVEGNTDNDKCHSKLANIHLIFSSFTSKRKV